VLQGRADDEDTVLAHTGAKVRASQLPDQTFPCHEVLAAQDGNEQEGPTQAQMAGQGAPDSIIPLSLIRLGAVDDGCQALCQALRVAMQLIELSPLRMGSFVQCPSNRAQEQEQSRDRGADVFALLRQAFCVVDFLVFGPHGYETLTLKQEPHRDVPVFVG
jgi:hypothetical protein